MEWLNINCSQLLICTLTRLLDYFCEKKTNVNTNINLEYKLYNISSRHAKFGVYDMGMPVSNIYVTQKAMKFHKLCWVQQRVTQIFIHGLVSEEKYCCVVDPIICYVLFTSRPSVSNMWWHWNRTGSTLASTTSPAFVQDSKQPSKYNRPTHDSYYWWLNCGAITERLWVKCYLALSLFLSRTAYVFLYRHFVLQ